MHYTYYPKGVCSQQMDIETDGSTIKSLKVTGGCSGNLQGIARLVEGMDIDAAISRLDGIRCGFKPTSCPDQFAQALKAIKAEEKA